MDRKILREQLTGDTFIALMKRRKTNKYRLAKSTGISYMTLWNWERRRQLPSASAAQVVARALGLIL